jgi:hypothetical protein
MRLITSGCSFTSFRYPTWPWFLADAYDETYNYGQTGAGNEYIFNSIIAADTDLHFREDDTVIVAWSGVHRYDKFKETRPGSPIWDTNGDWVWDPNFRELEPYVNETGWEHKSLNYMLATARYLTARNIKYLFTSLFDLRELSCLSKDAVMDLHSHHFIFPEGLNKVTENARVISKVTGDGHPNLMEHQRNALDMAELLGVTIKEYTEMSLQKSNECAINITTPINKQVGDYLIAAGVKVTKINPIYADAYKLTRETFPQYKNFFDSGMHIK